MISFSFGHREIFGYQQTTYQLFQHAAGWAYNLLTLAYEKSRYYVVYLVLICRRVDAVEWLANIAITHFWLAM
jgi:hypothetical protein